MSQTKKKKMKQPTSRLRTLVASLMLIAPVIHAANNTEFSSNPLVGVAVNFAPHVALALSVEFPTAGAAYVDTNEFNLGADAHTKEYLGYFDNKKCYKYNTSEGYFYPSSVAATHGLCNIGGDKQEFSGNMLNFLTMSAVDIFRSTMTGGNRAFGAGIGEADYKKGDTPTETYLRRARVVSPGEYMHDGDVYDGIAPLQNGRNFTKMPYRTITFDENNENHKQILLGLLPHEAIKGLLPDTKWGGNLINEPLKDPNIYEKSFISDEFDRDIGRVNGPVKKHNFGVYDRGVKIISQANKNEKRGNAKANMNTDVGQYDHFLDRKIYFFNDKFGFRLGRHALIGWVHVQSGSRGLQFKALVSDRWGSSTGMALSDGRTQAQKDNGTKKFYTEHDYLAIPQSANFAPFRRHFNVVVKVCDKNMLDSGNLCVPYYDASGNITHYKPEGLLQNIAKKQDVRFAALGYLNISQGNYTYNNPATQADTAVLRARMKRLIDDPNQEEGKYGAEWNKTTGQFETNPDRVDAQASNVSNSGVINYLNKFGDTGKYKDYDPAAELYYTALRYLMGNHDMTIDGSVSKGSTPFVHNLSAKTPENEQAKDGFPAIYDWEDPYKRDIPEKQQHCHKNSIIFIGDTGTHGEDKVPSVARTYLAKLLANESTAYKDANMDVGDTAAKDSRGPLTGSNYSPADIAGLAYWARTNNMRPDFKEKFGKQWKEEHNIHGSNFMIDVVEENKYKNSGSPWIKEGRHNDTALSYKLHNAYYLAAKYGGFNYKSGDKGHVKDKPAVSTQWALPSGHAGVVPEFNKDGGTPYNYAVANNPKAMKEALESAFKNVVGLGNPSQAATGLSIGMGEILDLRSEGLNYLLQSTYDYANLTGDVVVYKPSWVEKTNTNGTVERGFGLAEHARTGDLMKEQFHGPGYTARKVFTIKGNQPYVFSSASASNIFANISMPAGVSATQLTNYILGDNSLESGTLRERAGLQGTVINSTATPILKAKAIQCAAPFSDAAKNRPTYYAAAANDGMLHIFDTDGNERMAYMAGTALDKLPEFASIGFQHQYLNDGTPVIQDLCLNNTSQTVLIGTTGRGGKAVYALNVTDISKPSTTNLMWEFSNKDDSDLGLTVAKPIITKGKDGKQYAIVSSGYHTDGQAADNGYIFILDIGKTGSWQPNTNYWKVKLGKAGVGAPFVYDSDNDGIGDKIFVGDEEGKVWQLDRSEKGSQPFVSKYGTQPLFAPNNSTFARPITGAPFADMVNGKLMVTVGTGRYFSENDLSTTQQNYAYGLIVDDKNPNPIPDDSTNILEQYFETEKVKNKLENANVYAVSERKMDDKHRGWRLTLVQGMNIASPSLIRQRQVAHFVFARNTGDISVSCVRGANAGIIEVDVKTGGLFPKPLIDTDGDGQFTEKDARNAAAVEFVGMNTSVGTLLQYHNHNSHINVSAVYFNDGGKPGDNGVFGRLVDLRDLSETNAGVRRISWREIF